MSIIEFYRMDRNNVGDWYSNPCQYFFSDKPTTKIDILDVRKNKWLQSDTIIVGGGGLIGNLNFENVMNRISVHPDEHILRDIVEIKLKNISDENKDYMIKWRDSVRFHTLNTLEKLDKKIGPRVLWGAGFNSREKEEDSYGVQYPTYLNNFHLVGIRDYVSDYRWVPCASCMHPAFDKKYEIKNKFVWFEHKKRLIDVRYLDLDPAPRMINAGQNMEHSIEFLGSAETVVTNSYHGVYWATLLGRRVVCVPWGSKFNMFKHPPTMANEKEWPNKISKAVSYPNALKECRDANIEFYEDVVKLIDKIK